MKLRLETSRYARERATAHGAASYNTKYERIFHKRISNRRERELLRRLLARIGPVGSVLDVPSGAGRVSDLFYGMGGKVCEADTSLEMLKLLRLKLAAGEQRLSAASVFHLPFRDRAFDLVASIRLSHHIADREGRHWHLRELMRVSRRHVLVSFFDAGSLKNRLRELSRRLGSKKRGKHTLSRAEVLEAARPLGFEAAGFFRLSAFFSGHTFALLQRSGSR